MAGGGDSPVKSMGKGYLSVLVLVGGTEIKKTYHVQSIETVKEINRIPYAKVVLTDGDVRAQDFPASKEATFEPGKEIEVKVGYGPGQEKTIYKGVIVEHGLKMSPINGVQLVLKCKDKALAMTVGRKNKMFFKKKDSDIISSVVSENGLSASVEATSLQHKKLVQYYCTDWDFVQSRADVNGLVTIINDGKITIKKPTVSAKTNIKISYGVDLLEMNLNVDSTYQLKEIDADDWAHAQQKLENAKGAKPTVNDQGNLDLGKLSKVINPKEHLQTSAHVTKEMLQPWADAVFQRYALSRIRGTIRFYGSDKMEVGKTVELFGFGDRFNGNGYISKVRHTVERGQWITEVELGLSPRMYLEENPGANALPASGLLPGIHGLQIGVVKQIHEDPDGEFRVLVNIPIIDKASGEGIWVRKAHYYATKKAGYVFYPEVGDEVVIGFLNNDPTHGVILGSLYSSKIPLSGEHTPDKKNTFKAISTTEGKLKIEIEDVKKIITIITPKKHKIVMDDDKDSITIEDPVNKNKMVFDSKGILLDAQKDITVKTKANFILEAMQDIKTKSTANTKMEATANFEIKATAQMKAEGTAGIELKSAAMAKLEGAAMTQVKGGIVMIN